MIGHEAGGLDLTVAELRVLVDAMAQSNDLIRVVGDSLVDQLSS